MTCRVQAFPVWLILCLMLYPGCASRQAGRTAVRPIDFHQKDKRLVWPLPITTTARITSTFGRRKDPITGRVSFHYGVDLDGETGTPIHAAGEGKVTFNGWRKGYGLVIIIDHGKGLSTYYGHCSMLIPERGERVDRGQVIALMGSTGRSTGSHLHFETRKHGRPFDPVNLLPELRRIR
ncbi:MAG: M23 family metallopeptidase [Gemmatimonadota bacterium]|nr:M23 family metallopeptidase [Gemmatimonadota bacterium]